MTACDMMSRARGIASGSGCSCAVCGPSSFGSAGPRQQVLGGNFTAFGAMADASLPDVCLGCASLLAGRPGDTPPPLRMFSFWCDGTTLRELDRPGIWAALSQPPSGEWVLSWAQSRQVHHWLYAGVSNASLMRIGSDVCTIEYRPDRDRVIVDTVHALLYSPTGSAPLLSRASIVSGDYHPSAAQKFGAARLASLDAKLMPYRNLPLLDLVASCAPMSSGQPTEEEVIDEHTRVAARLLAAIAGNSEVRSSDGKMFWGGFFKHRVERFKGLPLDRAVSRLIDECGVSAPRSTPILQILESLRGEEEAKVVDVLRGSTALCVSLAYETMAQARAGAQ